MKRHTNIEIEAACMKIWPSRPLCDSRITVLANNANETKIEVSAMYESPPLNLDILMRLADFFGTRRIDDSRFSQPGCETCDYGSKHGFILIIRPEAS